MDSIPKKYQLLWITFQKSTVFFGIDFIAQDNCPQPTETLINV